MPTRASEVAQVRRFNRVVTQRVGALSDRYLSRDRPLGASRVLWEVGEEGCEVRTLRSRLDIDSGQLSRVLRTLEADGLIELAASPLDARIRVARLTATGLRERRLLDARSDTLAESMLRPLSSKEREQLLQAMHTVERLLSTARVEIRLVDPASPDARRCLRAYFAE